jgi:hypothetical protein
VRPLHTVAVKVFLHHQLSALVEQDAVYILISAVEDVPDDGIGCGISEV